MIRVLHVTQAVGGIKTYITNIIAYSDKHVFEHGVACPQSDLLDWTLGQEHNTYEIDFVRAPNPILDLKALFQVIRAIKTFKPNVIHAHSGKGGFIGRLAGRLTGVPTAFTPNAFSYLGFQGLRRQVFKDLERLGRAWTDILLAVSESERRRAIDELGYPEHKTIVAPNSIAIPFVKGINAGQRLKNRVGMIGRLLEQKNPEMFIRVAKNVHDEFPDCRFSLLGEGFHDFLRDRVYTLLRELDAQEYVSIHKWGGAMDAQGFIRSCDIYVLTSRFEGLPFTLLEAMALRVPVVATDVDGNRDVVSNGLDGYLVKTEDVDAMSTAICNLLMDRSLRASFASRGRETVSKNFNIVRNIAAIESVYMKLSQISIN